MPRQFPGKVQIGLKVDTRGLVKKIKGYVRLIQQVTDQACQETARKIAQVGAEEARDIIDQQKKAEVWPPLKAWYLNQKIKEGYDPRMLVRSGFYLENIKWWKVRGSGKGKKAEYRFGVTQRPHPDAKMPLGRLASIHEYGTRTVPARPFWRPLAYNLRRRKAFLRATFRGIFTRIWKRKVAQRAKERG